MIEVRFVRKDHVTKKLWRQKFLQISGAKTLGQLAIVRPMYKGASADHDKTALFINLYRRRKAM